MAFGEAAQILINTTKSYAIKHQPVKALLLGVVVLTVSRFLWKVGLKVLDAELH